jgi:hypothetical protein
LRAALDGEPVEVLPVDVVGSAVLVPAGRHRLEMWMAIDPTHTALPATVLGIALLAWVLVRAPRDRAPRDRLPSDRPRGDRSVRKGRPAIDLAPSPRQDTPPARWV